MSVVADADLGIVVIGRNEGERLKRCLQSAMGQGIVLVYVDSGSTDGSAEWALSVGAEVVALDMSVPFTAARARNAGLRRLQAECPGVQLVQFLDGDCELRAGWLGEASGFLRSSPRVAAVCGRLRERHPETSVYNRLCDIEWNTPLGESRACGGIAMMRVQALLAVGGFNEALIAGEEPELCVRLRGGGWQIWRLPGEMAWHDASMHRFSQWWRRTRRSGHAFAEGRALHGGPPEYHYTTETRRAVLWGLALPALVLAGMLLHRDGGLLALAYPLQMIRLGLQRVMRGEPAPWAQAFFLVVGRVPEGLGVASYWWSRWRRRPTRLIEYK